jgi:hypothetical protein
MIVRSASTRKREEAMLGHVPRPACGPDRWRWRGDAPRSTLLIARALADFEQGAALGGREVTPSDRDPAKTR